MRRSLLVSLMLLAFVASAQGRKPPRDAALGKKDTATLDKTLAGDITRPKAEESQAPTLQYDQFRLGVELQVASKRREQIASLKKIISLSRDPKELPSLLFRLGELYWEESKFFFFEANRKDDDFLNAMNRNDKAAQELAKSEKADLVAKSKEYGKLAVEEYKKIVQNHRTFERTDEVLFFLGQFLMESGDDRAALVAFKRLIDKWPKSRFIPDAHLAFGEYYFNNSKGKRDLIEKALASYKKAAEYPDNQVYAFALYKQGWCYFNLADYANAKDKFKTVVLYGELAGAAAVEKDGGKSGKSTLIKEARTDFVRAYARDGDPTAARAEFAKVASKPDDRFMMMKQLANLYYEDGKDREAALTFNALIKERPLSPDAPGFQGKIVDCVLRMGNKERTVTQVRRLVKIMQQVEKAGVIKTDKDKKSLAEAKELSERTLSNLAVTWHNEARKTRDDETFAFADIIYGDYLTLFPDNPKAYDLRFFWAELLNDNLQKFDKAAANYTLVVLRDAKLLEAKPKPGKPGKWLPNAAYNAVLAYDEVVKADEAAGKIKPETSADLHKKLTIPPSKQALLDACERYVKYVPNGDKRVEISFKAANIYYRHNHFDEAVKRFSDIALNHPEHKFENGERASEIAANLILDSYNLLQDFAKVNEWARRFYSNEKLATGKFREDLSKVIEQSAFKLVNQLEAKKEYAKAAEAYLTFVAEFPSSEIADKALYNASVDFYNAKMLDRAIETRKRIISQYPKSSFIPACIYANAEAHEAIGDFEDAADSYELYVRGYERNADKKSSKGKTRAAPSRQASRKKDGDKPAVESAQVWEESKAQIALFNAATYRDGLGQFKAALRDRELYLELWPKAKDAEQVFLSIADVHEKSGAYGRALKQLEAYEAEYQRNPSKLLSAEGRIAKLYEEKLRRPRDAQRIYSRINVYYEKLARRVRKDLEKSALSAVAQAQFLEVEKDYRQFTNLRLSWGKPATPEKFKTSVAEKGKALDVVQKAYIQTVAFGAPEPAICALHRIGLAYDNFADKVVNAPMPPGLDEESQQAVREEFANQAQPLKAKAAEAFTNAVAKSQELDVFNDCAAASLKLLRTTYRPEQFPLMPEEKLELKVASPPARGGDLLASIQPIPNAVAPVKSSGVAKAAVEEEDLEALNRQLRAQTASSVDDAPSTPSAGKKPGKAANTDSEEPEDFL